MTETPMPPGGDDTRAKRPPRPSRPAAAGAFGSGVWGLYDLGWRLAIPFLRRSRRLAEGYGERCLQRCARGPVDIWIQAASAGEAYLALALLEGLRRLPPLRILVTTQTSQGMEILGRGVADGRYPATQNAYFPFDRPSLMQRAVSRLRPRLAVLLETELWPGHLSALKAAGSPVLIVNGRLTPRSLGRYLAWPAFWQGLAPERILAVSTADARRFAALFPASRVGVMPNIKFDRLASPPPAAALPPEALRAVPPGAPFVVLGSVRRQEEASVARMIALVRRRRPDAVIGLFPRHMHRIEAWGKRLEGLAGPWRLRSRLDAPALPGNVILWDTFGALSAAYDRCQACFVGGSLAPLGGQNFLEPASRGVLPVIGPHWDNFAWVGREVLERGLVREVPDWRRAAEALVAILEAPPRRQDLREAARVYLRARRGGTAQACREIEAMLTGRQGNPAREA